MTEAQRQPPPGAPLPRALHEHLRLLVEPGRALDRDHASEGDLARQLLQRQGTNRQNRAVRNLVEHDQVTVQLVRNGGLDPGEAAATLVTNLRVGTLEWSKQDRK